jgi:hypothetical protein
MNNSKSYSQYNGNQSKISNLSQDDGLSTIQRQTKNNVEDINISLLKKIESLEKDNVSFFTIYILIKKLEFTC